MNSNKLSFTRISQISFILPIGRVTKILDTSTSRFYSADYEYIPPKNMIIRSNFLNNTISAYRSD